MSNTYDLYMRTTVRLPQALLSRARACAQARGVTLTALIEEGLEQLMSETAPTAPTPWSLPVCTAGGGLRPGRSLESPNELLFDLDVAEGYGTEAG
jgi:hypothetical protein